MIKEINEYIRKNYISFHTPCHMGRNKNINNILKGNLDLTELSETDNLFFEEGIIKDLEEKMVDKMGGKAFYPLVNGATSGIMASFGVFSKRDKILVDRNSHISVINAIKLNELNPVFINTTLNEYNIPNPPSIDDIKEKFRENKDVKGIFITNPNYYGMWADLKEIIDFAKANNLISIVDEAHGSHYYYFDKENTAINLGADIAILSFHKNLPSLTQTGGILINNLCLKEKIKENLRNYTSTSPSYIFMQSIEAMDSYMESEGKNKLIDTFYYLKNIKNFLKNKGISILTDNDPFKFVVNTKDADLKAHKIKEKYKIVCEMCDKENVTYIISIHNYKTEVQLLKKAILEFLNEKNNKQKTFYLPEKILCPYEVSNFELEDVLKENSVGRISGETVIDFPPSVPIVVSGEKIDIKTVDLINREKIKCVII